MRQNPFTAEHAETAARSAVQDTMPDSDARINGPNDRIDCFGARIERFVVVGGAVEEGSCARSDNLGRGVVR
ncbi:hypothetical protein [Kitasatospora griseola]|nr:hypothetical protein [Kitasatospora griseola]